MTRRNHTPNLSDRRLHDASGQTMTEYAFILALIFAVVIATVPMIGTAVSAFFTAFTGAF